MHGATTADAAATLIFLTRANAAIHCPLTRYPRVLRIDQPTPAELAGQTSLCTSYSKLDPIRLDFKTRTYYSGAGGELLSKSDAEGLEDRWVHTNDGLTRVIPNKNGCGSFNTLHVVRRTGDGNLIAEVVLDLDAYIELCTGAGYDTSATRELQLYSSFTSVLSPKYVAGIYEFCKPKQ